MGARLAFVQAAQIVLRNTLGLMGISAPEKIERGVPFEVSVEIKNGADAIIENAELKLSSSGGLVALNGDIDAKFITEPIGNLGGGSLAKKTFRFCDSYG